MTEAYAPENTHKFENRIERWIINKEEGSKTTIYVDNISVNAMLMSGRMCYGKGENVGTPIEVYDENGKLGAVGSEKRHYIIGDATKMVQRTPMTVVEDWYFGTTKLVKTN